MPTDTNTLSAAAEVAKGDWTPTAICVLVILLAFGLVYKLLSDAKTDRDRSFQAFEKVTATLDKVGDKLGEKVDGLGEKVDDQGKQINVLTTEVHLWKQSQAGKRGGA